MNLSTVGKSTEPITVFIGVTPIILSFLGTHWIYEIVNMLLHGKEEYRTNHCFIGVTPIIFQEHTGSTKLSTCSFMVGKSIEPISVSLV